MTPSSPADRRPLLVWQAGVPWDGIAGTDRHLVEHLAAHVDVLWVDPPRSVAAAVRDRSWARLRPSLHAVGPGVTALRVPAPPGAFRPGVDRLTLAVLGRALRGAVRRLAVTPAAVVTTSPHPRLDVLPGARRVYYATDDFVAGAALMGKSPDRVRRLETARVAVADVVGAVSPEIMAGWDVGHRTGFVLPNGCDTGPLAELDGLPRPDDAALEGPVVGLVGQLSPRVDLGLLEAVADAGLSLLLVGPRQPDFEPERLDALLARPRVAWVGAKRYAELPAYLNAVDVGLTPYVPDAFNRASFPLKTLEYLAAGRGVVTTDLPAVARLGCPYVRSADDPADFVAAVRATLDEGDGPRGERRRFAAAHDWSVRARDFLEATGLGSVPGVG